MYKLSKRSLSRLEGINPVLLNIVQKGIVHSPHDFGIPLTGGLRTADDQHKLFLQGVSKCDGYNKKSYHQSGNAFDVYAYVNGKASWDKNHLKAIADHLIEIAKNDGIKLGWGGDFKSFYDGAHFEIK